MKKIKQFIEGEQGKDILTVIIIILVGLGSFGLGRLSKAPPKEGLKIEYRGEVVPASTLNATKGLGASLKTQTTASTAGKAFFASSRGTKYYSLGCSGGKTIKQENRVYFGTKEEAEKGGYELSSACK